MQCEYFCVIYMLCLFLFEQQIRENLYPNIHTTQVLHVCYQKSLQRLEGAWPRFVLAEELGFKFYQKNLPLLQLLQTGQHKFYLSGFRIAHLWYQIRLPIWVKTKLSSLFLLHVESTFVSAPWPISTPTFSSVFLALSVHLMHSYQWSKLKITAIFFLFGLKITDIWNRMTTRRFKLH